MPTTVENLKEAFAGESQANQKYRAFAKKAEKDGFPVVARLFRMTAEAERIHAEGHLGALDGIGDTAANLQAAIDGETYETKVGPRNGAAVVAKAWADPAYRARLFKDATPAGYLPVNSGFRFSM